MSNRQSCTVPLVLVLLSFCGLGHGQSRLTIHRDDIKTAPFVGNSAILLPIRCDVDGNFFYREMEGSGFQVPLVRMAGDAQSSLAFDVSKSAVEELKNAKIADFALQRDGSVFQMLSDTQSNVFVAHFKSDSSFDSYIRLNLVFEPKDFSVLSKGSFIVRGLQSQPSGDLSLLALFDASGRFIRSVDIGGGLGSQNVRQSIYLSTLDSSGDMFYILRPGSPSEVVLISAAGLLEKRIHLDDPSGMRPVAIRGGPGRFLVQFASSAAGENEKVLFVVYDNFDGSKVIEYELASDVGGSFGCYDWKNKFEFLALSEQMHRQIVSGTVR